MITEYKNKSITWLDLENPTQKEAKEISEKYDIDPLITDELLSPTLRPRVDYHKDYIYLILHFPVVHSIDEKSSNDEKIEEVDFILGKNFIITTRYNAVDALLEFSKSFEVQKILDKKNNYNHAGYVFYFMIRHLYKSLMNRIANIQDLLVDVEQKIFSGQEKQMVFEISRANRLLLSYRQSTTLHREILESFEVAGKKFFGTDFNYYLHSIIGEYFKIHSELSSAKEYLDELRDTNNSLLSTKQNEIIKILTVITFAILPLSLIATIFGMNTLTTPIIGTSNDFFIIIGIMLVLTSATFLFFKIKKWL